MTRKALDDALLAAYAAGDRAQIGALYAEAAKHAVDAGEQAFFLTQAYVFALEVGSAEADTLRQRLLEIGADR